MSGGRKFTNADDLSNAVIGLSAKVNKLEAQIEELKVKNENQIIQSSRHFSVKWQEIEAALAAKHIQRIFELHAIGLAKFWYDLDV